MSKWMGLTILAAGLPMILGYPQQPSGTAAMIEDQTYGDPAVEPYTEEGGRGLTFPDRLTPKGNNLSERHEDL